jgi:PKD repeat protein
LKLSLQKLALALALIFAGVQPALAQSYPYPGKITSPAVKCTGCEGANTLGQLNDGLFTWPYATPIAHHVGRFCDSTGVTDFQGGTGYATARARLVRYTRTTNGAAPPRAYVQLANGIAVYSLSTFFTSKLPAPMVTINAALGSSVRRTGFSPEKVAAWDAAITPENGPSGWTLTFSDGQDKLFDFDVDDRGYVYVATGGFYGWGLVRDSGQTGGSALTLVAGSQFLDVPAQHIVAVKSGSQYFAVVAGPDGGRTSYDVTNAGSITQVSKRDGAAYGFSSFARDDARERVAIVTTGSVKIYENANFANGSGPITTFDPPSGKLYQDVTADESGNFWTSERTTLPSSNRVVKFERGANGYTRRTFDVFGEPFTPEGDGFTINYGDKYLTVVGRFGVGSGLEKDVKIFKIENGEPVLVNVGGFVNKYYYKAERDYATPTRSNKLYGVFPIKWNNKLYLTVSSHALGDVYELETGDSISVSQKSGIFGTTNPYAKSTSAGPYYGDLLKFNAVASGSTQYSITWNFDNPESGSDNTQAGNTGSDGSHQFSGLDTTTKINTVRSVKAVANSNSEVNGAANVTLKVPTARIGIAGTEVALTTDGAALDIIAGDQLTDASDGTVEGHYSAWTVDSTSTNQAPDQPLASPAPGDHTLTLAAKYGKYSAFVTNGSPYTDSVSNIALTVRPFVVSFANPVVSGNAVTFKGTARVTQQTSVLSATTWDVEWSLKNGQADVVPPQTSSANVGSIPDFQVADRTSIPSGSILQLKVSVSSGLGTGVPSALGTHTLTQTLLTPDPKVTKSGCAETTSPCSFTVSSLAGNSTSGWTVTWTLKTGSSTVATSTLPASQTYSPTISTPGTYTVTAKAATQLFEGSFTTSAFTVTQPACANPPTADQIAIFTSCSTCSVGSSVTIRADAPNIPGNTYSFTDCEEYLWDFGDGAGQQPATSQFQVSRSYSSSGSKTIRLTIRKGSQLSPEFRTTIVVGSVQTCPAPTGIQVTYSGSLGCRPTVACKTGETVFFQASRGSGGLLSCDNVSWSFSDGGSSSSFTPAHAFSNTGTASATVTVTNTAGTGFGTVQIPIVTNDGGGGNCNAPPDATKVYIDYVGQTSGCSVLNGKVCAGSEQIKLRVLPFAGAVLQSCDKIEWNFGDGSALSSTLEPTHSYVGNVPAYHVTARIWNTTSSTGNTITVDIPFPASVKPTPTMSYASFPSTGSKGVAVSFTASASIPATGWTWTFGDGSSDTTQASAVGTSNTVTHTYATSGTFKVTVKARNADDVSTAPTSQVDRDVVIEETPEYRYLLPVVAHANGIGSVWRTDVQIYSADANISPAHPQALTASYKGVEYPLNMTKSTLIIEDILDQLRPGQTEQGSMIIAVRTNIAPQIWSRTYNQTPAGTFGQFIPAILLNEAGGGSAFGEGRYYLAGLKSDSRYRTNVGLVNPNGQAITAVVRLYDDLGPIGQPLNHTLQPFQLDQFPVTGHSDRPFSIEIEVPDGMWLIGYASLIDGGSSDPVYLQAVRESELGSADYRENVIPGVGHVGDWRSDVTVYNSDGHTITVDLAYHDAAGSKVGEAKAVPIRAGEFLQYSDLLKQGVFGTVSDGVGMLRVSVPGTVSADHFPLTYARTYNDNGTGKTYGQGIAGFASNRANVRAGKSGLIPGVRSNDKYYTNIGLTNVSSTVATVVVKVLDPNTGLEVPDSQRTFTMQPNQSIVGQEDLKGRANASLRIEVSGGNVWAFASIIDRGTLDPEYVPATPLP